MLVQFMQPCRNLKWPSYDFLCPDKQYLGFNTQACHLLLRTTLLLNFTGHLLVFHFYVT